MTTTTVTARVDADLKKRADGILEQIGLTATTAINAFYRAIVRHHGIPFELTTDPFYDPANQARLQASIDRLNRGEPGVVKTLDQLEELARG